MCLAATTHCVQCGHHHHYAMTAIAAIAVQSFLFWTWESWKQLELRNRMIVRGRAKVGLDAIFTPARQTQALLNLLKNNTNIDDLSDAKVEGGFTGRLVWEDKEECDVDNCGGGGREGGGYGCQHCCMFGTQCKE